MGTDDTLFSPLALSQYLGNFDPFDEWFIAGKSENEDIRKNGFWDVSRDGGGTVLSSGFLENSGTNLEQ